MKKKTSKNADIKTIVSSADGTKVDVAQIKGTKLAVWKGL